MKRLADSDVAPSGAWLATLRAMTAEQFVNTRREQVSQLFSSTSKGVHSEFVVPPGSLYDRATIANLVTRIVQTIAELALLANLVPHVPYKLSRNDAIDSFNRIEALEVIK